MGTVNSTIHWQGDMAFDAVADGFNLTIDASDEAGGTGLGPRPKTLVMTAWAGCTAMDVNSVLRKMRGEPASFQVRASGHTQEVHPKKFIAGRLTYRFEGDDLPLDKLRKAVTLSRERYCMVSATLEAGLDIDAELVVNGEVVPLYDKAA